MDFVTAYGPKLKVSISDFGPSRTKQYMKEQCDINFIVKQFQRTGLVNHVAKRQGDYGDFASMDLHEAMNQVLAAQDAFLEVPAHIRKEFRNDPAEFFAFVNDPGNREKMADMGLLSPEAASAVKAARVPAAPDGPPSGEAPAGSQGASA